MRSFNAYIAGRLVRSFNARDLAERYVADMARIGAAVEIRIVRLERRAA